MKRGEYVENAKPNEFLACLDEIYSRDDDRPERIALTQEFGGACLFGIAPRYGKALITRGRGNDGKNTVAKIIEGALPPGSVCSLTPSMWSTEWHAAHIVGKLLNVVSELPEKQLFHTEIIKAVITGDPVSGRRMRRDTFTFRPVAGHYFATNLELPAVADMSRGFWRRWIVLPFTRCFDDGEEKTDIASLIIASEGDLIASWFVEGAARLVAQNGYTIPQSAAQALEEWRYRADPVGLFISTATSPAKLGTRGTKASLLAAAYNEWADARGLPILSEKAFGSKIRTHLPPGYDPKKSDANYYPVTLVK
jgi:P4 family phage/plasmid primase-like protien